MLYSVILLWVFTIIITCYVLVPSAHQSSLNTETQKKRSKSGEIGHFAIPPPPPPPTSSSP
ncbi:unnamed protein product, partial [Candidula unifasciata]